MSNMLSYDTVVVAPDTVVITHSDHVMNKMRARNEAMRKKREIARLKELGYVQEEIGRKLNVSQSVVSRTVLYPSSGDGSWINPDVNTVSSRQRRELNLLEKLEIVGLKSQGYSQVDISKRLNVNQSVISRCLLQKRYIVAASMSNLCYKRSRRRYGHFEGIEDAMTEWFGAASRYSVSISPRLLVTKARRFARLLGYDLYSPQHGWFVRWKERNSVITKEELAALKTTAPTKPLPSYVDYTPQDTYSVSEISINTKSDCVCSQPESLTVLLCSNQTGCDKRPLLVLGNQVPPHGCSLPCQYEFCYKSWITSDIFVNWLIELDYEMKLEGRRIILILDSSPVHPEEVALDLSNIGLYFLHDYDHAYTHPFSKEVHDEFVSKYREDFIQKLKLNKLKQPTLLDILHMLNKSWLNISQQTIQCSYWSGGFRINRNPPELTILDQDVDQPKHFSCNSPVLTSHGIESDEIICKNIAVWNEEDVESSDECSEKDFISTELPSISTCEMLTSLSSLKKYLLGNGCRDLSLLNSIEEKLTDKLT